MSVFKKIRNMMWRRIRHYQLYSWIWWMLRAPLLLYWFLYCKIKKKNFERRYTNLRLLNELRKTANYYSEKDAQKRQTLKVYYQLGHACIRVRMRFDKRVKSIDYDSIIETLNLHASQTTRWKQKQGYIYFSLIKEFQPLMDYYADRTCVSVGTSVDGLKLWVFQKLPHLLCIGETGEGKSVFIRYVLIGLLNVNFDVWCIDGKVVDYANSISLFKYYVANQQGNEEVIVKLVEKFQMHMHLRLEDMRKKGIDNYIDGEEMDPRFLLMDEYLSIVDTLSITKELKLLRARMERALTDIIMLGRATGCFILLTMQRSDTKYIPGAFRDNMRFKIVLGDATDTSYRMMFEEPMTGFSVGMAWSKFGNELDVLSIPFYKSIEIKHNKVKDKSNGE